MCASLFVRTCVWGPASLTVETRSIRSGWSDWSSPGSYILYTAWAETPPPNETRNRGTTWQTKQNTHTDKHFRGWGKIKITCLRKFRIVCILKTQIQMWCAELIELHELAYIHLLLQRQGRIHSFPHHVAILWHSELHPTSRQRTWPWSGRTQPLCGRRGTVPFCTIKLYCWPK